MSEVWEVRTVGTKGDLAIYPVGAPASAGRIATVPAKEGWRVMRQELADRIASVPVMEDAIKAAIISMTLGGFGHDHPVLKKLARAYQSGKGREG